MTLCAADYRGELGKEVRVSEIERELRFLWEEDDARCNASLINLVVYSEEPGSLAVNSELARDLTQEHACRVILVEIDRAVTDPSLRAWITAHCHLSEGGKKSMCCEQIAFRLTGRVTGRFRNTVFAHLASDLPLVFWWQGELSDVLTERLASAMDRLIVDSRDWANPLAAFRRLEDAAAANPGLIMQDHAWTRTWQFRLGVASLFDDPAADAALGGLHSVEISHAAGDRNSALQLLAWLAVQAGWEDEESADEFLFRHDDHVIQATLREVAGTPALSKLVLRGDNFEASVSRTADDTLVRREVHAGNYQAVSFSPADPEETGALLGMQLARGGKNTLFRKILPRFVKLLERITCL